jgi:hypothetical protein
MKKIILLLSCLTIPNISNAATVTGTIKELYASNAGSVAFTLHEGFPQTIIESECPTYNGYAGIAAADAFVKSVLLAAQISGKKVRLSITGCQGAWLKVNAVYLQPS